MGDMISEAMFVTHHFQSIVRENWCLIRPEYRQIRVYELYTDETTFACVSVGQYYPKAKAVSSSRTRTHDAHVSPSCILQDPSKCADYSGPHTYGNTTLVICNVTCMRVALGPQVTVTVVKIPSRVNPSSSITNSRVTNALSLL